MNSDILLGRLGAGLTEAGLPAAHRDAVVARVGRWLRADADADADVANLVEERAWFLLADAFADERAVRDGRLCGPVGVGPNRLNERVVAAAVAAYAATLGGGDGGDAPLVLVAWDGRESEDGPSSLALARVAAEVLAAAGAVVAWASEEPGRAVAEPELVALVRRRDAAGGLYCGAASAPPGERGLLFVGPDGAPRALPPLSPYGTPPRLPFGDAEAAGTIRVFTDYERDRWHAAVLSRARQADERGLHVVFSSLNGVAGAAVGGALARAGFRVTTVREQSIQDPTFAAVPFRRPDPSRDDTLETAVAVARDAEADLALVCDATGTRIGAVVPDEVRGFRRLAADEVAALIADHVFAGGGGRLVATTTASPLIARIAAAAGATVTSDLAPGFEGVGAALRAEPADAGAPFLAVDGDGLTVRPDLPTADAAAPAVLLAERAAMEKAAGRGLPDALRDLWRRHGYVAERRRNIRFEGPGRSGRAAAILAGLRVEPPRRLATRDLTAARSGDGDTLTLLLGDDARAVLAPTAADDGLMVVAHVAAPPFAEDADPLQVAKTLGETEGKAIGLLEDLVQQALLREGVSFPRAAFAVPDFVGVDLVAHAFQELFPHLEVRVQEILARYTSDAAVRAWLEEALAAYGPHARDALRPGLTAHVAGLRAVVGARGKAALDLMGTLFG